MEKIIINQIKIHDLKDDKLTFEIPKNIARYLSDKTDIEMTLQLKKYVKGRSLNQNAMLWALINEIDLTMNGRRSKDGQMAIYINLIEMANVKTTIMQLSFEALQEVLDRNLYRYIEVLEQTDYTATCRCFYGSSDFTTKEMADFIEATLDYASEVGLDLTDYEQLKESIKNERV